MTEIEQRSETAISPDNAEPVSSSLVLTPEQERAIEDVMAWIAKPREYSIGELGYDNSTRSLDNVDKFVLSGAAGTGKTTLLRAIVERCRGEQVHLTHTAYERPRSRKYGDTADEIGWSTEEQHPRVMVGCCSFTGKAASVMRKKGVDASTIHSMIYRFDPRQNQFYLRDFIPFVNLIVVDEASTVSRALFDDLVRFNIPLFFIGDPFQLEPVGDDIGLAGMSNFMLHEIHRQAAESPVLAFATALRSGAGFAHGSCDGLRILPNKALDTALLEGFCDTSSQIICGKNTTRVALNVSVRTAVKGIPPDTELVDGEKLICLRNDRALGVFNGETGTVSNCQPTRDGMKCDLQIDGSDRTLRGVTLNRTALAEGRVPTDYDRWAKLQRTVGHHPIAATYGYAITAHKSQGSEWDRVLVVDEAHVGSWNPMRWRYTAVTRARNELVFVSSCR